MHAAEYGAIEYRAEVAWGEDVNSFDTARLPVIAPIDISGLDQQLIDPMFLRQRRNEGFKRIKGGIGGEFTTRFHLPGYGGATNGELVTSGLPTFLSYAFGKLSSTGTGGTFTGGTATAPTSAQAGGLSVGGLIRAGVGGLSSDGRGAGGWGVIDTIVGSTINMLVDLPGAPNNGDPLHSSLLLYEPESAGDSANTLQSIRTRFLSAGLQYSAHGVFAKGRTYGGFGAGETPWIEIRWGVSWWEAVDDGTFPSTATTWQNLPDVIGGGAFFLADVGTPTRSGNLRTISNFQIEVAMSVYERKGHNGVHPQQSTVGACLLPSTTTWRWSEYADSAADATPTLETLWRGGPYHGLWEGSRTAGSAIAAYAPRMFPVGKCPIATSEGGVWHMPIAMTCHTSVDTTSNITLAALLLALG